MQILDKNINNEIYFLKIYQKLTLTDSKTQIIKILLQNN